MKTTMEINGFCKFILPFEQQLFQQLSNSVDFEEIANGRKGNHLVHLSEKGVPIVRTTTKYNLPANNFSSIHQLIAESIKNEASRCCDLQGNTLRFNNALIEIYERRYAKMKYHSDQCLDLENNSHITLFSCYERPEDLSQECLRKLKVKSKTTEEEFEFTLENNSVVLFSLSTNTNFLHKIVLEPVKGAKFEQADNRWLGMTLRQSKTWIHFKNDVPYFPNGEPLKLANEVQSKEFYRLRGAENNEMDFIYPTIDYTLNVGDTLAPRKD